MGACDTVCGRLPAPGRPPAGLQKGGCIRVTSPHPRATDSGGPRGPAQAARGEVSTLYPSTRSPLPGPPTDRCRRAPPGPRRATSPPRTQSAPCRPRPSTTPAGLPGLTPAAPPRHCLQLPGVVVGAGEPHTNLPLVWGPRLPRAAAHGPPYPWPRRPVCRLGLRGGSWVPFGNVLTVHPYTEFSLGHWHPPTQSCRWPASRPSAAPGVVSTCLRPHRHRGDGSRTEGGPQGHLGARLSSVPTVRPGLRPAGRDPGCCPPPTCTQRPRPSALPHLGSSRWREWGSRLACQGGSALCWTDRELEVLGDAL